jgi:aspartate racemase
LIEIVEKGRRAGADSVILGYTEIGLLIGPEHLALPTFDSTFLHADEAVRFARFWRVETAERRSVA